MPCGIRKSHLRLLEFRLADLGIYACEIHDGIRENGKSVTAVLTEDALDSYRSAALGIVLHNTAEYLLIRSPFDQTTGWRTLFTGTFHDNRESMTKKDIIFFLRYTIEKSGIEYYHEVVRGGQGRRKTLVGRRVVLLPFFVRQSSFREKHIKILKRRLRLLATHILL